MRIIEYDGKKALLSESAVTSLAGKLNEHLPESRIYVFREGCFDERNTKKGLSKIIKGLVKSPPMRLRRPGAEKFKSRR